LCAPFYRMESKRNIFLIKATLVFITLVIFTYEFGRRDAVNLSAVLAAIPLVFAVDVVGYFTKRKISPSLEVAYLFFILMASTVGVGLMAYHSGFTYDKIVHFCSGILTIFMARELFGKDAVKMRPLINFMFYIGLAALVAAVWETFEFTMDQILGTDMQRVIKWGVKDTMVDVLAAMVGAIGTWVILHQRKRRRI